MAPVAPPVPTPMVMTQRRNGCNGKVGVVRNGKVGGVGRTEVLLIIFANIILVHRSRRRPCLLPVPSSVEKTMIRVGGSVLD